MVVTGFFAQMTVLSLSSFSLLTSNEGKDDITDECYLIVFQRIQEQ